MQQHAQVENLNKLNKWGNFRQFPKILIYILKLHHCKTENITFNLSFSFHKFQKENLNIFFLNDIIYESNDSKRSSCEPHKSENPQIP